MINTERTNMMRHDGLLLIKNPSPPNFLFLLKRETTFDVSYTGDLFCSPSRRVIDDDDDDGGGGYISNKIQRNPCSHPHDEVSSLLLSPCASYGFLCLLLLPACHFLPQSYDDESLSHPYFLLFLPRAEVA